MRASFVVVVLLVSVAPACTLLYSKDDYERGGPAAGPDAGDAGACPFATPVYELVNPTEGAFFFTTDPAEADRFAAAGFTDRRGVAFRVAMTAGPGRGPVYRIHDPTNDDRVWTVTQSEVTSAKPKYPDDEGVVFYAGTSLASCLVPVYGLEHLGFHTLTVSEDERASLIQAGWTPESIRFFAAPP